MNPSLSSPLQRSKRSCKERESKSNRAVAKKAEESGDPYIGNHQGVTNRIKRDESGELYPKISNFVKKKYN